MKKWQSIVAIFVLLAILIGTYSYIKSNPKQSEEVSSEEQQEKIKLTQLDSTSISKIEIENTSGNIKLEKQNDKWIMNDRNDINVLENTINNIIDDLSSLEANLIVSESSDNLADYGLDNPSKVTITLSEGEMYTFLAGNNSPTGNGFYFMNVTDTKIYMLSSMYKDTFEYTFNDLIEKEKIPNINTENLNYVYIHKKGKTPIEIVKPDEVNQYNTWNSMSIWEITSPYNPSRALAMNEAWDKIVSEMTSFNSSVKEFITNNANNLDEYGLNEPELDLILRDSDGVKNHLYFGIPASENTIYFKQEDSNSIYTMDKSNFDVFADIDLFSITDKFTVLLNIQDVKRIIIRSNDELYQFDLETVTQKQEDTDTETISIKCKVGDKEYKESDFKKLYQNLIGILIDTQYNGENIEGTADITMSFYMNDGKMIEAKYYKYNDKYYVFDRDGSQDFLVDKRQFDNVFQKIKDFFDGTISPRSFHKFF